MAKNWQFRRTSSGPSSARSSSTFSTIPTSPIRTADRTVTATTILRTRLRLRLRHSGRRCCQPGRRFGRQPRRSIGSEVHFLTAALPHGGAGRIPPAPYFLISRSSSLVATATANTIPRPQLRIHRVVRSASLVVVTCCCLCSRSRLPSFHRAAASAPSTKSRPKPSIAPKWASIRSSGSIPPTSKKPSPPSTRTIRTSGPRLSWAWPIAT